MNDINYEEMYNELKNEYAHSQQEYEIKIEALTQDNSRLMQELSELNQKMKDKGKDLIFLAEQYKKLKFEFDQMYEESKEEEKGNEEYIMKIINGEIENLKKEKENFMRSVLTEENFTFDIIRTSEKSRSGNNKMKLIEHKILSDNVDEILQNIQQKKEKLILTQKMMNQVDKHQNN